MSSRIEPDWPLNRGGGIRTFSRAVTFGDTEPYFRKRNNIRVTIALTEFELLSENANFRVEVTEIFQRRFILRYRAEPGTFVDNVTVSWIAYEPADDDREDLSLFDVIKYVITSLFGGGKL